MKNSDETFDDELRRRLRAYKEEPDVTLWHNIAAAIREAAPKRPNEMLRRVLLATLVLIVGGRLYYLVDTPSDGMTTAIIPLRPLAEKLVQEKTVEVPTVLPSGVAAVNSTPQTGDTRSLVQENEVSDEPRNPDNVTTATVSLDPETGRTANPEVIESPVELTKVNDRPTPAPDVPPASPSKHTQRTKDKTAPKVPKDSDNATQESQEKKDVNVNIYFTVMPTFGYQAIESNSHDNIIIESIDRLSTFSTDRLGVRAELGAESPITNRLKIFGGLIYFQRKQTIGYTEKLVEYTEISPGDGGDIILEPQFTYVHKTFEYELQNLGVQVGLNYQFSKRKLLQTAGTGIEFHFALNKLRQPTQSPEFTNNPSLYVFYNLYYRLQYPAEGRLKAVFQPTLNYSFYINQNLNAPFYVKPYGLGLNIGFTYNF